MKRLKCPCCGYSVEGPQLNQIVNTPSGSGKVIAIDGDFVRVLFGVGHITFRSDQCKPKWV